MQYAVRRSSSSSIYSLVCSCAVDVVVVVVVKMLLLQMIEWFGLVWFGLWTCLNYAANSQEYNTYVL